MTGFDLDRAAVVLSRLIAIDLDDTKTAAMERALRNILALVSFSDYASAPETVLETIRTLVEQVLYF